MKAKVNTCPGLRGTTGMIAAVIVCTLWSKVSCWPWLPCDSYDMSACRSPATTMLPVTLVNGCHHPSEANLCCPAQLCRDNLLEQSQLQKQAS